MISKRRHGALVFATLMMTLGIREIRLNAATEPCNTKHNDKSDTWYGFANNFKLKLLGEKSGEYILWKGQYSPKTFDSRIDIDKFESGKRTQGTLILIGGRVLGSKGIELKSGYEIDEVDVPFLLLNLTAKLLERAFPEGPKTLKELQVIDLIETKSGIEICTPSASASFSAPWKLKGKAVRTQAGAIDFDLGFSFNRSNEPKPSTLFIVGSLSNTGTDLSLSDSMSVEGWQIYGLGPQMMSIGNTKVFDYGTVKDARKYKTIGEIRRVISEKTSPGLKDASTDFTGFWKEKCEHDFGLQIKHVGTEGMYSVSFCGPGGCFDPGTYRPNTFLNKDQSYQIISANEIKVLGSDGWSTYHKCSADPNAVQK